ncbi:MAG TPA: ABC transporter permease [Candidatus Binatia bacterium]|nr:ABC transporter permease [Candidatus Binatia bacterium]
MIGPSGFLRVALRRIEAAPTTALVSAILVLAAASSLASGVLYADTVADGGLRRALLARPPDDRAIRARLLAPVAALDALDAVVRPEMQRAIARAGGAVGLTARTVVTLSGRSDVPALTVLAGDATLPGRATLEAGRWPTGLGSGGVGGEAGGGPIEVALPSDLAARLGLRPGDRLEATAGPATRVTLVVTGLWRPGASDPLWAAAPLAVEAGTGAGGAAGPALAALADASRLAEAADVEWTAVPNLATLRAVDAEGVAADVAALATRLAGALPRDRAPTLSLGLADALRAEARTALVGRAGVLVVTIELAGLALYGVLLLSALLADRRVGEAVLLRARGAGAGHVARLSLLEAAVVALPVVVLGPLLAYGVVRIVGSLGPLAAAHLLTGAPPDPGVAALVALGTMGVAVLAIALAAPGSVLGGSLAVVRAQVARAGRASLVVRLGLDVVVVLAAALAVWQLRFAGGPLVGRDGTVDLDPVLVAGPAIGLLGGVVVALRIVPRLTDVGQWLAGRRRGAVLALAARQVARRPLRFLRLTLLLMLATGLATLSAAYAATWERSQQDQAAYQAATGIRIIAADYPTVPEWLAGAWYGRLEGVTGASAVTRRSFDAGRSVRDAELVGLEPEIAGPVIADRAGSERAALMEALDDLRSSRPVLPGIELPAGSQRLRLVVDARLKVAEPWGPVPGEPTEFVAQVRLLDGHGRLVRLEGPRLSAADGEQVVDIFLGGEFPRARAADGGTAIGAAEPLRLVAVGLAVYPPGYNQVVGTIELRDVLAATGEPGATLARLEVPSLGWTWTRIVPPSFGATVIVPYPTDPSAPGRITLVVPEGGGGIVIGGDLTRPDLPVTEAGTTFELAPPLPSVAALSAIVDRALAERAGVGPGDLLPIDTLGLRVRLRIAAVVERFPPLDPDRPFAVVDGPSLELAALAATRTNTDIDEWWLTVELGREAGILAAVADGPTAPGEVVGREARAAELLQDPIAAGLIGALVLASLTGLTFAVLGVVLGAIAAADERATELAVLRALGFSRGNVVAWLTLEQSALLSIGLGAGIAVGVLLAWLVLPALVLTPEGLPPVPPVAVEVPWSTIALLVVGAPLVLASTAVLLVRRTARLEPAATIRAGEI